MFHAMRNRRYSGTERELVSLLLRLLGQRLPSSWTVELQRRDRGVVPWDGVIHIRRKGQPPGEIFVEVRKNLDPKDVPRLVEETRENARGRPVVVAAGFLSPQTRRRLTEAGASYVDATGNLRVVLDQPAVFVEGTGADKNPERENRPLASLKGPAAGRVVRAVADFTPPYGVREIATRSRSPLGSVARVVALLDREGVLTRNPRGGIETVDLPALIRRWTQDYSFMRSNLTSTYLEPRGTAALLGRLQRFRGPYAITGSLAAATLAPTAAARLAALFVEDPSDAAQALGLRPAETGANVVLGRPFDPVVFERGRTVKKVRYASPSQVAADLLTSPGRGPSEAEALLQWMEKNPDDWRSRTLR
jgi:hypothetical protein